MKLQLKIKRSQLHDMLCMVIIMFGACFVAVEASEMHSCLVQVCALVAWQLMSVFVLNGCRFRGKTQETQCALTPHYITYTKQAAMLDAERKQRLSGSSVFRNTHEPTKH